MSYKYFALKFSDLGPREKKETKIKENGVWLFLKETSELSAYIVIHGA